MGDLSPSISGWSAYDPSGNYLGGGQNPGGMPLTGMGTINNWGQQLGANAAYNAAMGMGGGGGGIPASSGAIGGGTPYSSEISSLLQSIQNPAQIKYDQPVTPLSTAYNNTLTHNIDSPGLSPDQIQSLKNSGADQIAEQESSAGQNLRAQAEAAGFGRSGADMKGQAQLDTQFAGAKQANNRDVDQFAAQNAQQVQQAALGQAGGAVAQNNQLDWQTAQQNAGWQNEDRLAGLNDLLNYAGQSARASAIGSNGAGYNSGMGGYMKEGGFGYGGGANALQTAGMSHAHSTFPLFTVGGGGGGAGAGGGGDDEFGAGAAGLGGGGLGDPDANRNSWGQMNGGRTGW